MKATEVDPVLLTSAEKRWGELPARIPIAMNTTDSATALFMVGGASRIETCPLLGWLLKQLVGAASAARMTKDTGP